jgi:hypothetical protein
MKPLINSFKTAILLACLLSFTSCLTAKKLDAHVRKEYNNELPKPRKAKADIVVNMMNPTGGTVISTTKHKTDKFLPLLFYWKYDHRQACEMNNAIALTQFANTINSAASKPIEQKLNGQKLELSVEQIPSAFAIVAKENVVWLIYAIHWAKIYVEPDPKDLVVRYKLGDTGKTGTITIKNTSTNQNIRFFQSWKSATSEHLSEYNAKLGVMTKSFITQLAAEI